MQNRQFVRDEKPDGLYRGVMLTTALTAVLLVLVLSPPFVGPNWRGAIMGGFSTVCHQMPERSPLLHGVALAVCHRCFGVYVGLFAAPLIFFLLWRWEPMLGRYAGWFMLLALAPGAIDWIVGATRLYPNTPTSRVLTGGFFGLLAGLYLARAFVQMANRPSHQNVAAYASKPEASL